MSEWNEEHVSSTRLLSWLVREVDSGGALVPLRCYGQLSSKKPCLDDYEMAPCDDESDE